MLIKWLTLVYLLLISLGGIVCLTIFEIISITIGLPLYKFC
jgi:hypothetical protein